MALWPTYTQEHCIKRQYEYLGRMPPVNSHNSTDTFRTTPPGRNRPWLLPANGRTVINREPRWSPRKGRLATSRKNSESWRFYTGSPLNQRTLIFKSAPVATWLRWQTQFPARRQRPGPTPGAVDDEPVEAYRRRKLGLAPDDLSSNDARKDTQLSGWLLVLISIQPKRTQP